jgi:hypothetical protein
MTGPRKSFPNFTDLVIAVRVQLSTKKLSMHLYTPAGKGLVTCFMSLSGSETRLQATRSDQALFFDKERFIT